MITPTLTTTSALAVTAAEIRAEHEVAHRGDRRRFLMWALMLGAIPHERMGERALQDIQAERAPCQ